MPSHRFATFGDLDSAAELIDDSVAAVLLEPIQSMAGVRTGLPEFYRGLRRICDTWGALLVYDEIQTGMGRTGEFFFAPRFDVESICEASASRASSAVPSPRGFGSRRIHHLL